MKLTNKLHYLGASPDYRKATPFLNKYKAKAFCAEYRRSKNEFDIVWVGWLQAKYDLKPFIVMTAEESCEKLGI